MIELRQLIYLESVYRNKSFTKASKALFVSQPTISTAVRAMEEELGLTLIDRGPRTIRFTPQGEALMGQVKALLSSYRDLLSQAGELSRSGACTLRLGIASIMSPDIFPLIYRGFLKKHPELNILLDEDSAHGQIRKLLDEELDLALNGLPEEQLPAELETVPVCRREIKLILHREHPLAKLDSIPVELLRGEPLSMLSSPGVMGQVLDRAFSEKGIAPRVVSEHSQILGMLEMTLTGCGIGFMNMDPKADRLDKYEALVLRPFREPLGFQVGFLIKKRRYIPPLCRELISYISKALG